MSRSVVRLTAAVVALAVTAVGCSTDDIANKALEDSGIEVNTKGGLPSSFPADVPVPDLEIETAVAVGEGFVIRLTSPDAVADVAAYRAKLEAAGFTVTDAFDNSATDAHNVGFTATGNGWTVLPVAFTQDTPVDGGYMGIAIDPAGADGAASTEAAGSATGSAGEAASTEDTGSGAPAPAGAGLPTGFPTAVPVPDLAIDVASGFADGFTLKLTSPDAVADIAAYAAELGAAGFVIADEFDLSADESGNVGFTATGEGWSVHAVAFTPDHGGYMSVSVDPAE